jgi:hypothetical protein
VEDQQDDTWAVVVNVSKTSGEDDQTAARRIELERLFGPRLQEAARRLF